MPGQYQMPTYALITCCKHVSVVRRERRSDVDDDGIIMERVQPGDFPAATARQRAAGAGVQYWDRDMDLIT